MKRIIAVVVFLLAGCAVQPQTPVCQPGDLGECKAVDAGLGAGAAE